MNPALRRTIVHKVLDSDLFGDACDLSYLERDDGGKRHHACAALDTDPDIHVVVSLPTDGKNIYVTLSNGDRPLIQRLFATLEDMEGECSIRLGNVQLFDDAALKARGICGVLLLPVQISNILRFLPDTITIDAIDHPVLLVVFLSEREHAIWKADGHDALMELFVATDKDLIAFGSTLA
jgi:hypothetical protein